MHATTCKPIKIKAKAKNNKDIDRQDATNNQQQPSTIIIIDKL